MIRYIVICKYWLLGVIVLGGQLAYATPPIDMAHVFVIRKNFAMEVLAKIESTQNWVPDAHPSGKVKKPHRLDGLLQACRQMDEWLDGEIDHVVDDDFFKAPVMRQFIEIMCEPYEKIDDYENELMAALKDNDQDSRELAGQILALKKSIEIKLAALTLHIKDVEMLKKLAGDDQNFAGYPSVEAVLKDEKKIVSMFDVLKKRYEQQVTEIRSLLHKSYAALLKKDKKEFVSCFVEDSGKRAAYLFDYVNASYELDEHAPNFIPKRSRYVYMIHVDWVQGVGKQDGLNEKRKIYPPYMLAEHSDSGYLFKLVYMEYVLLPDKERLVKQLINKWLESISQRDVNAIRSCYIEPGPNEKAIKDIIKYFPDCVFDTSKSKWEFDAFEKETVPGEGWIQVRVKHVIQKSKLDDELKIQEFIQRVLFVGDKPYMETREQDH